MKSRKTFLLFSVIFLFTSFLLFTACKKRVTEVNPDYVGYWEGADGPFYYTLNISSSSRGDYQKTDGIKTTTANGVVRIKDDKLKVGPFKKFKINQHPTKITSGSSNYWQMKLNGVTYERY